MIMSIWVFYLLRYHVESSAVANPISTSIRLTIDILLDYFPEILYFLDQENTQEKENANRKRNACSAPAREGAVAAPEYSPFR
jgi:hypothetical protein